MEGRVLDRINDAPVAEAVVTLLPGQNTVLTDADGRFCLSAVAPGRYALLVRRLGYLTPEPTALEVTGAPAPPVVLRLERGAVVEHVVVTPEPRPGGDDAAKHPGSMSRGEIDALPGTLQDPVRALTALPGVAAVNDYKGEIRLDGGEPEDTLFLVDGVLVSNPYHFQWARGSAAAFGSSAFDHLSVESTGLGAEIGDTVSGVVRLEPTERGAGGAFFEGSIGTLLSSFSSGGSLVGDGSWVTSFRYSNLGLYRDLYGVDTIDVPDLGDAVFRFRRPLAPGSDLVGGVLALTNALHTSDPSDDRWEDMDARGSVAWAGLDAILGPRSRLSARGSWSGSRQRFDTSLDEHLDANEERLRFLVEAEGGPAGNVSLSGGVEGGRQQGSIAGAIETAGHLAPLDADSTRLGAYGSARLALSPAWTLVTGLRYDRDSRFGAAPVQARVRAEYADAAGFACHFGAGRYAQFPRFDQEFLAQGEAIGPTSSDEVSAGATFPLSDGVAIDVNAFARRMHDLTAETVNQFPDLPEPMGLFESGRSRGLGLSLRRDGERARARLSLTLIDAEETRAGVTTPRNGSQPWLIGFAGGWNIGPRWSILGRAQAGAGLPYSPMLPAGDGTGMLGPLNGARLPAWARVDLRAAWTTNWGSARVSAYVEIANLLGAENVRGEDLRWDDSRQAYETRQEPGMPRLPGFGLALAWGAPAGAQAGVRATRRTGRSACGWP